MSTLFCICRPICRRNFENIFCVKHDDLVFWIKWNKEHFIFKLISPFISSLIADGLLFGGTGGSFLFSSQHESRACSYVCVGCYCSIAAVAYHGERGVLNHRHHHKIPRREVFARKRGRITPRLLLPWKVISPIEAGWCFFPNLSSLILIHDLSMRHFKKKSPRKMRCSIDASHRENGNIAVDLNHRPWLHWYASLWSHRLSKSFGWYLIT